MRERRKSNEIHIRKDQCQTGDYTFLSLVPYMVIHKQIESVDLFFDIPRNLRCKVFEDDMIIQVLRKDQRRLFKKIRLIMPNTIAI